MTMAIRKKIWGRRIPKIFIGGRGGGVNQHMSNIRIYKYIVHA